MPFVRIVWASYILRTFSISKIPSKSSKSHTIHISIINSIGTLNIKSKIASTAINKTYIRVEILVLRQSDTQTVSLCKA